ncbi:bifunctional phosphopantothenoylcysteine decarboxylase/phosphopantothenate--cysteine ligase CoaBC [Jeotgalibaca caeni]|uniref:bifunctional phosphopantothenoylcysteine decarboxylase/phosphopantothenate--cysteine ligase CoaBC n=1 Tax=Jeotgalibaca caeni TaxID=3028623 RepID=UPI00237DAAA2|nr:bifunctional phosphopantothenoylcysteine decarboxylase/phosphopantothenate--cysteine ligase CoaBC [Jeotgalibaca caeni]MDE1548800.1 bifunctional phosphopantothenoylcysteine decarboxylase/phosphopantothenate--cysteine ligase CoaBC [Jeotgalibaca caeni]
MLENKNVTVFVTGGIAVYKACDLIRRLIKAGANVRVAMTKSATQFVQPLTFQVLAKHPVYLDTFDEKEAQYVAHIHLADWTELAIVAPATANTIAKMATGIADDMVSTTLLATTAPRLIVPAMNEHMWENPATKANLQKLKEYGYTVMDPDTGFLAEGYEGKGRLPEPSRIVEEAMLLLLQHTAELPLRGTRVVVSAGGTKERIDPVRYLTNQSSGKMGYRIAEAARDLGATVTLVTASNLERPFGMDVVGVSSALEMQEALMSKFETADIVVMAAAVSDFRPVNQSDHKIKKTAGNLEIELEKNPDILAGMGQMKKNQFLIGFAAETDHLEEYAQDKLKRKNADMIVANDVSKPQAGFDKDTNEVIIFQPNKEPIHIDTKLKSEVAKDILQEAIKTITNL